MNIMPENPKPTSEKSVIINKRTTISRILDSIHHPNQFLKLKYQKMEEKQAIGKM